MAILFIIAVLIGFVFHFLATWPAPPYASRIAWGSWLVAAILWAVPQLGLH
jgi:hypothetical protein